MTINLFRILLFSGITVLALGALAVSGAYADKKKTSDEERDDAIKGAVIGAGVGAIVGGTEGAVAGGVAGAIIGKNRK